MYAGIYPSSNKIYPYVGLGFIPNKIYPSWGKPQPTMYAVINCML